ncbi:MAG: DNA-binding heavy metal response regulator [Gemmataceae bacterium]|nr:DNA-binding heavy metal response regulator [Gemmataceae bacterium]
MKNPDPPPGLLRPGSPTRLLLVEDDPKTVAFVRKGLAENGYTVDAAATGDDGLARAAAGGYDLIVLDVMLPAKDGWTVLRELRAAGVSTPVLFLTARDGIPDRVMGLELGADDYLVKPFAFAELLARIRTILRRGPARSADVVRVADLEVDLVRQKVTRGGAALDLTPKEFSLVALLARRVGEVLSRDLITEHVWDVKYDPGTNVVDVHVRRLRSKVDDPFEAKLIHTVRGVGYVLEARR